MFEIGTSLRDARVRRRVDFAAAEQATKIRAKYLRALEDEQFDLLPAETYVRGFLRTYAEFLGLDGQLYVDEYNSRFVAGEEDFAVGRARRSAAQPRRHRRFERSALVAALLGIAAVAALVIAAWKFGGGGTQAQTIPGLGTGTTQTRPRALPVTKPHVRATPRRVTLVVAAASGSSWLQVHKGSSTGRLLYEGTLDPGTSQRFVARRLWLDVGAPANVRVRLNGHRVALPSKAPATLLATRTGLRPASG